MPYIDIASSFLGVPDLLPHLHNTPDREHTYIFKPILMSSSVQMLTSSIVMLVAVASMIPMYYDVASMILIIEPRYLNFGIFSISVSSIRTRPISFRFIAFVFVSLTFRQKLSVCLFTEFASFPILPLAISCACR